MILTCPKCSAEIKSENVNLSEGIANCIKCGEFFRIASHLLDDEEIRRIKKPFHSRVSIEKSFDGTTVIIPSAGWTRTTYFMIFFTIFWVGITWSAAFFDSKDISNKLFFIPFFVAGIVLILLVLFLLKGKTILHIDNLFVSVSWEVFKFKFRRTRKTNELKKVTEDVVYTQNYQPVYGIGLFFVKGKTIRFGSGLTEEERKWLIGELNEVKSQYVIAKLKQRK